MTKPSSGRRPAVRADCSPPEELVRRLVTLCSQADADGNARYSRAQVTDFFLIMFSVIGVQDPRRLPMRVRARLSEVTSEARRRGADDPVKLAEAAGAILEVPASLVDGLASIMRELGGDQLARASRRALTLIASDPSHAKQPPVPPEKRTSPVLVRASSNINR